MSNAVLLRVELGGVARQLHVTGRTEKWRQLLALDHATLCAQFGLDPFRVLFDLPTSARGTGSAMSGAGGTTNGRRISGYILDRATREPIGTITWVREGDRFRDVDPTDEREFLRLD